MNQKPPQGLAFQIEIPEEYEEAAEIFMAKLAADGVTDPDEIIRLTQEWLADKKADDPFDLDGGEEDY